RVSTRDAGAVTGCATGAWFFAPAGTLAVGTGPGHRTGCPSGPLVHAAGGTDLAPLVPVGTLEVGLGAGLGLEAAAAGAALKDAPPPRTAAATPTITRRRENGDSPVPRIVGSSPSPGSSQDPRPPECDNVVERAASYAAVRGVS